MGWGLPCQDSNRVSIRAFGRTETWHRAGIGHLKYAELLALRTRYGRSLLELASRASDSAPYVIQTYACRNVRGGETPSNHSWPRAVDVKPWANPMRDDGVLVTDFTRFGFLDGLRFVSAWLAAGFEWGSTWSGERPLARWALTRVGRKIRDGRVDPMHFEREADPHGERAYWVRRVRAYALRHPRYVAQVKRRAQVHTIPKLVEAWWEGRA
jgi:hypothetical protein